MKIFPLTLHLSPLTIFVVAALLMTSCYEDEGNYDYHALDQVSIDTVGTGILPEYAIMRFDTLELNPDVVFNGQKVVDGDDSPLDYQWTIFSAVSGASGSTVVDTIGNTRHLKAVISRTGGNYYVQLVVTNRNDNIRQFLRIPVSVSEVFDGGWMVFYERNDVPETSDLALIYNSWTKLNANYNRYYTNLYETTNGTLLKGKPIRCLDIAVSLVSGNNYVGLCTDQTLVGVSENGIEQAVAFHDFFHNPPSTVSPTWYGEHGSGVMSGQNSEIVINDNKVYTNTYSFSATEGRNTRFGVAKYADDEIGMLAPWNAEVPGTLNYGVVVYDQTNHCFRYAGYNEARLQKFGEQDMSLAAFDVNDTGMDFVMADWGRGESMAVSLRPYDYLIMAKGSERYLAVANFATTTPTTTNIGVRLYALDGVCPDIQNITSFAASHVGSFVYYAAGSRLYDFAYDSQQTASVAWEAPSADETITCVRIMKYYHGTVYGYGLVPRADNLVHIATWNETTHEGKVYQYLINPASGILNTSTHYEYSIPGRVKDMAWKFSMQ